MLGFANQPATSVPSVLTQRSRIEQVPRYPPKAPPPETRVARNVPVTLPFSRNVPSMVRFFGPLHAPPPNPLIPVIFMASDLPFSAFAISGTRTTLSKPRTWDCTDLTTFPSRPHSAWIACGTERLLSYGA